MKIQREQEEEGKRSGRLALYAQSAPITLTLAITLLASPFLSSPSCLRCSCRMLFVEASLHPYLLALGEAQPPCNRHATAIQYYKECGAENHLRKKDDPANIQQLQFKRSHMARR